MLQLAVSIPVIHALLLHEDKHIDSFEKSVKEALKGAGVASGHDDVVLVLGDADKLTTAVASNLLGESAVLNPDAHAINLNPIVVVQKHQDIEPDKDKSDQGAIAKEAQKIQNEKQHEGEVILSGGVGPDNNLMIVLQEAKAEEEEHINIEDLTSSKKERLMSGEFLLISSLVLICWTITEIAAAFHLYAVQMPLVCTVIGLIVGTTLNVVHVSNFLGYLEFSDDIFFMMLLPPIIFESGFNLDVKAMHRNATPILYFAFLGTFLSFLFSSIGFGIAFSLLPFTDAVQITMNGVLSYGALISATDPVSVMAIFKEVAVSPSLKAIVTGESLMNDAISISLYRSFSGVEGSGLLYSLSYFLGMFFGSIFVGYFGGCTTALIFKWFKILTVEMKISLMIMFSYISYLLAEFAGCSGIVAILFCGVSQAMYTLPNIELITATSFRIMIGTLSHIAESVAFIYLGMAFCFLQISPLDAVACAVVTIIVVSLARYLAIHLTASCLSMLHGISVPTHSITALTMCGLRGAVAFGLAKHARHDYGHGLGNLILVGTLSYSLFTVIAVGPTIPKSLQILGFCSQNEGHKSAAQSERARSFTNSLHPIDDRISEEHKIVRILKFLDSKLTLFLLTNEAIVGLYTDSSSDSSTPRGAVCEIEIPHQLYL